MCLEKVGAYSIIIIIPYNIWGDILVDIILILLKNGIFFILVIFNFGSTFEFVETNVIITMSYI